jgi:hypothetical protein
MIDGSSRRFIWRAPGAAALLSAIALGSWVGASQPSSVTVSEVLLPGAPDHGVFDPSVASDGTGNLYMSLSGVSSTPAGAGVGKRAIWRAAWP